MTVIENLCLHIQYTYHTGQQLYPIAFQYLEREHVKVKVRDQYLTYNVHYTVPLFNEEAFLYNIAEPITDENIENVIANQLNVELLITPEEDLDDGITIADGDTITIFRHTPLDQQQEFPQNGKFSSQKITEALDKLTYQQQEQTSVIFKAYEKANEALIEVQKIIPKFEPFIHTQSVASDQWVIQHNIHKLYPKVTVIDSVGTIMYPSINFVDEDTCTIQFIGATTGTASIE